METPEFVLRRTRKWNRVSKFVANPCDAPLMAYVETFFPAAGKAIITLLSFGLDDVARGYFRPKGLYPQNCLGRRRRRKGSVGIPEVGEEIGKRLPGADPVKSRSYGGLEKNLWLIDGVTQRVFFWFMVIDVVTDFAFNWTQGIYKKKFCEDHASSQFNTTGFAWCGSGNPAFSHYMCESGFFNILRNVFHPSPQQVAVGPGKTGIIFTQWTISTPHDGSCSLRIILGYNLYKAPLERQITLGPSSSVTFSMSWTGEVATATAMAIPSTAYDIYKAKLDVFQVSAS